tara:strand:- start:3038 stop:3604 length:567 start_codon:yes stop_codon:yes gene_type:complete
MKTFNKKYTEVKIYYVCAILVIVGSINCGSMALGKDLVQIIANKLRTIKDLPYEKIIYLAIATAGIILATNKDFWMPFLGDSVLPHQIIPLKNNKKYDTILKVPVPKGAKVAYWAALPNDKTPPVTNAYGQFNNSGVVMADNNGIAELKVLKGSGYIVPSGRYIAPHVHYRVLNNELAMMGPVKKVYY